MEPEQRYGMTIVLRGESVRERGGAGVAQLVAAELNVAGETPRVVCKRGCERRRPVRPDAVGCELEPRYVARLRPHTAERFGDRSSAGVAQRVVGELERANGGSAVPKWGGTNQTG